MCDDYKVVMVQEISSVTGRVNLYKEDCPECVRDRNYEAI